MRLWVAQIAPRVGDIAGNVRTIVGEIERAAAKGADLCVFPELAITGYPPEDLLFLNDFLAAAERGVREVAESTRGRVAAIFGAPRREKGRRYNSAFVAENGRITGVYDKQALPNYGVFDEMRYFTPGEGSPCVFPVAGRLIGVGICEDIWRDAIAAHQARMRADLWLNLNASPFHVGKQLEREALVRRRAAQFGAPVVYVNPVGGQDEIVFDGGSFAIAPSGELLFRFPLFAVHTAAVEVPAEGEIAPLPPEEGQIYQALVLGVRDYVERNGCRDVVIGLSGGVDSSLTAAIAADALGPEHVLGVRMPSRFTSAHALEDAEALAANLGIALETIPIEPAFVAFTEMLNPLFARWGKTGFDVTEENIQARARGVVLMAISNKTGRMVLSTGNKSETAVGYATLYGDMAGGFAPLKDVYKTQVYAVCRYLNREQARIPERVLTKPPSAELRPDQKDEDTLPPYPVLDGILRLAVEEEQDFASIVAEGYDADTVRRVLRMLHRAEYKRRQGPPGIKITRKAFGRDRRFPITHHFRPWEEGDEEGGSDHQAV
ncbi:MAG: NAD+ synthase [Zetaproteobacteria bacterium]|nr:MAG: NAD+ synthase [Zetaproteobacteria bacterium]